MPHECLIKRTPRPTIHDEMNRCADRTSIVLFARQLNEKISCGDMEWVKVSQVPQMMLLHMVTTVPITQAPIRTTDLPPAVLQPTVVDTWRSKGFNYGNNDELSNCIFQVVVTTCNSQLPQYLCCPADQVTRLNASLEVDVVEKQKFISLVEEYQDGKVCSSFYYSL